MKAPPREVLPLARKLAALPEPTMRDRVLTEYLSSTDASRAVRVLSEIHILGKGGGPPFNIALLSLASVLSREQLDYELQVRLYAAAKEEGLDLLLQLFLSSRGGEHQTEKSDRQRELTLGHRKSLARGTRREQLDRLLRDPEPEVMPILLQNPRLTERDVVALAARRPTRGEVQWQVFSSRKWLARYAVKRTLVLNPYTPTEISLRLLGFLNASDLRLVCSSPSLPAPVRDAAELFGCSGGRPVR